MQGPPKFSSFRPKITPIAAYSPAPASKEGREKEHRKERSSHRGEQRDDGSSEKPHRSRHHREHGSRHHKRSGSRQEHRKHDQAPATVVEEQYDFDDDGRSDLYVVDRRGDVNNLKYGYNEKYKVPIYKEPSLRKLLGDRGAFELEKGPRRSLLASLSANEKQRLRTEAPLISHSTGQDDLVEKEVDFITLDHGKKRRRTFQQASQRFLEKRNTPAFADADSSDTSESSEEVDVVVPLEPTNTALRDEKVRLTRLVKDESTNAQAWLEYIDFQDTWIHQGREVEEFKLPREEQRSLAEVRLSIYQKALSSIAKTDPKRERLFIGMMTESEVVLESAKHDEKWNQVVADNPGYMRLRQRFLEYSQTNIRFDYNVCRERCLDYFAFLDKDGVDETQLIHAILYVSAFMSQAGYREHAVAIWQALFDLNCSTRNARLSTGDWQAALDNFELVWDGEEPRFGECTDQSQPEQQPGSLKTQSMSPPMKDKGSDTGARRWLRQEEMTTRQIMLPGRVADDDGMDDVYHVVLFSDIRPFLLQLSFDAFPHTLVNAFLCFMRLPPLNEENVMDSSHDPFLRHEHLDLTISGCSKCKERAMAAEAKLILPHYRPTIQTLFSPDSPFTRKHACESHYSQARDFTRLALKALVSRYPEWIDLAEYYLAFTLSAEPSVVRKEAKGLLKTSPASLRLYNAYGLIELRGEHANKGVIAIQAAIKMSIDFNDEVRSDLVYLWHTLIWEAICAQKYDEAWQYCLSITRTGAIRDVPASDIADAEHFFNNGRQHALDRARYDLSALNSTCLCLLYYLSSSRNISTAIEAFATQTAILSSYGPVAAVAIEALQQAQAALIEHHVVRTHSTSYVPAIIRTALQDSIASFPTNTIFLSLYAETEARYRIDDRVRQVTRDILTRPSTSSKDDDAGSNLIISIFAIETELRRARSLAAGSTRHAVRAAFERAAADKRCRHNGSIWSMYLDYELSLVKEKGGPKTSFEKNEGAQRVMGIVYRGLRCLPWLKAWYVRGVQVLLGLGEEAVAEEMVREMVDRGLRVVHELEED